jgi:ABC-2 type transport system ATP-binding protein
MLSSHGGRHQIKVSFAEALEQEWLTRLDGVELAESNDRKTWTLSTPDPESLRKQLMGLSLQHNLNIVSLQTEHKNLEDIFRNLTKGDGDPTS